MAEMWYYTTEGKQMDPVTMRELKRLVGEGVLKPTDMVWKDGMARWIRASSVKELFPDPSSALDQYFTHTKDKKDRANALAVPAGPAPIPIEEDMNIQEPRRNSSSKEENDDAPPPRRRPSAAGGSGVGIIIALVIGAVLILGALGVGVFILIVVNQSPVGGIVDPRNLIQGEHKYELVLNNNSHDIRSFSFLASKEYEFIIKTAPQDVDVDIYIFNGNNVEAFDERPEADCYVRWKPRVDGVYRVEIKNLDHGGAAKSTVLIREFRDKKDTLDKKTDKDEPLPPDILEGGGLKSLIILPKKEETLKFRVRGGHPASFRFVPGKEGPGSDFNLIVVKDSNPDQVIKKDMEPGASASVKFSLPTTEIVRVRVINNGQKAAGTSGILEYDVSPKIK